MKIAVCTNYFAPLIGGAETVARKIAEYLAQRHEVTVFTRRVRGRNHARFEGYKVTDYIPGDQNGFMAAIQKFRPDVVLIYSDVFDYFRHLISRPAPYRIIAALCGGNWIYSNRSCASVVNHNLGNIYRFVVHSTLDRDYKFCQNPRMMAKTVVIPNGVDINEFDQNEISKEDLIRKYGFDKGWVDKRWVLNVSNFFPGKGQEHVFPILGRLSGEFVYLQVSSDIDFPIGIQLENNWKMAASKSTLESRLIKNAPREDVVAFFKQSSVFAFTSEKEVAPIVLLESMAATLPWVSTDVGNANELKGGKVINAVKNMKGHSLFDGRVHRLFAEAIDSIWGQAVYAEAGRMQIEEDMNWEKVLPQYASLIES